MPKFLLKVTHEVPSLQDSHAHDIAATMSGPLSKHNGQVEKIVNQFGTRPALIIVVMPDGQGFPPAIDGVDLEGVEVIDYKDGDDINELPAEKLQAQAEADSDSADDGKPKPIRETQADLTYNKPVFAQAADQAAPPSSSPSDSPKVDESVKIPEGPASTSFDANKA